MGKIICEVCGTVYPDSSDSCPICGYSRDQGGFTQGDDYLGGEYGAASQDGQSYEGLDDFDFSEFEDMPRYGDGQYSEPAYQQPKYQQPQQPQYRQAPRQPQQQPQYRQAAPQQPRRQAPQQRPQQPGQRQIFDYDAVNPRAPRRPENYDSYEDVGNEVTLNDYPQDNYDNYDNYNQGKQKSHVGLIVFLILLILALIGASCFLLFKFILPNLNPEVAVVPETSLVTEAPTTMPTTEPTIPCQSLALVDGGLVELSREGQFYLIHASISPEDTTDTLSYKSENENVVLVDEGGKITAVGEGETNVILTCGLQMIKLPVKVLYQEETQPTEEATAAIQEGEETAGETEASEETAAEGEENTEAAEGDETTEATEPEVELKLKKTDLMSGVQGVSFRLELDCDLDPKDVEWSSTDSRVALVKDGVVTTVGNGTCKIVAKYKGQEASCVIRCTF